MTMMLEFAAAPALLQAVPRLRAAGHKPLEAFTPCPVPELAAVLEHPPSRVRPVMLAAALAGAVIAFGTQTWSAVVDLPLNSGGRPLFSWPAFLPVTFELAVLFAAIAGFLAFLTACGLPRLHHPLFDPPAMGRASADRFLLAVEPAAGKEAALRSLAAEAGAIVVHEVPA